MTYVHQFFKGFLKGTRTFGKNISIIINSILLTIVYVFGIGLTSFAAKLFKKKFLKLKLSKNESTYWSDLDLKKKPMEEYYRQF